MATTYPTSLKQWLGKVVSFNTVSSNSNLPFVEFIRDYLKTYGVGSELVYNAEKTHAALWATFPGEDGATQGGIILSGHTDVVPVDGQKWDSDPFVMTERDGKLYGRGTSDMKGFIAVCLAMTPTIARMKRAKPVHFAFSFDEETTFEGIALLTDHLKAKGLKADCCLVGDGPYGIQSGNKGIVSWTVTVKGKAIHSSMALMNTSCNAIEHAAMIIAKIREIAMEIKTNGVRDKSYPCPFSCMSVGTIKGGNAVNTVPAECEFTFSIRLTDNTVAETVERQVRQYIQDVILPAMTKEYAEAAVEIRSDLRGPVFSADERHPFTKLARSLLNDPNIRKRSSGTECGFFAHKLGIPTVLCGAGNGIGHVPNEFNTESLLDASYKFTHDLIRAVTVSPGPLTVPSKL